MIKKLDGMALPDYQYIDLSLLLNWFSGLLDDVRRITVIRGCRKKLRVDSTRVCDNVLLHD